MAKHDIVFLVDVDNTLLDNDRVAADLMRHLVAEVGRERQQRYWALFEELRKELGYADYLGALQRYRVENPRDPNLLTVSLYLTDYPFANRLYPNSLDVIDHLKRWGPVVILSDGDAVFQPRKIERSGLYEAVDRNVLIYIHKEQELDDVERRYPARHYVMIDDKLRILDAIKAVWSARVTTVFPRQGHYAHDAAVVAQYPPADVTVERIGDLLDRDGRALRGAARPAPARGARPRPRRRTSRGRSRPGRPRRSSADRSRRHSVRAGRLAARRATGPATRRAFRAARTAARPAACSAALPGRAVPGPGARARLDGRRTAPLPGGWLQSISPRRARQVQREGSGAAKNALEKWPVCDQKLNRRVRDVARAQARYRRAVLGILAWWCWASRVLAADGAARRRPCRCSKPHAICCAPSVRSAGATSAAGRGRSGPGRRRAPRARLDLSPALDEIFRFFHRHGLPLQPQRDEDGDGPIGVYADFSVGRDMPAVSFHLGDRPIEPLGAFYSNERGFRCAVVWPVKRVTLRLEGGEDSEFGYYGIAGVQWVHPSIPLALGIGLPMNLRDADGDVGFIVQMRMTLE
jgi:FMN phosphatase YigB (HAD superfamily)